MGEFKELWDNTHVIDANLFPTSAVDLIFIRANWEIDDETGEQIEEEGNPDHDLTFAEFMEALVRVANGRYKADPARKGKSIAQNLEHLVDNDILPNAQVSNAESFRAELAKPAVQTAITRHKPALRQIFSKYAGGG